MLRLDADVDTAAASPITLPAADAQRMPLAQKLLFALTIFVSAFLLFQVQPLIAKMILPWFGGVASVWTVCLVFFQTVLLLGYLYAHLLQRAAQRTQARIHAALLAVSLLVLPIIPKATWKPAASADPSWRILLILAVTIGLPYLLLSTTSPLLQAWYARAGSTMPYRFYALSNAGSMLALLTYPVLVEPYVRTRHQAIGWSVAYGLFAALCGLVAFSTSSTNERGHPAEQKRHSEDGVSPTKDLCISSVDKCVGPSSHLRAPQDDPSQHTAAAAAPGRVTQFLWVALAAVGSALLLAITNHITQNIAAVPFLWVLPLSLYLLTFIICFAASDWYPRGIFLRVLIVALGAITYALETREAALPLVYLVSVFCGALFVCCMVCHRELARLKPAPEHLTRYYLMISLGGALGAMFVALLAPHVFRSLAELPISIAACALVVPVTLWRDPESPLRAPRAYLLRWAVVALTVALGVGLYLGMKMQSRNVRLTARNFYGVLRVADLVQPQILVIYATDPAMNAAPSPNYRELLNGTINHGLQWQAPAVRMEPTTYYSRQSGVGIAISALGAERPLHVGVVGLGAGTLAAYGRAGDRYTFYEINPLVMQIANREFSFLKGSKARVDIVPGDARLSLEAEAPQQFDVLAVDAFSGDSIPVHLLTREAFQLYFRHLKPDGVLAVHISNQYLDLEPVVNAAAAALGKMTMSVSNGPDEKRGIYAATWVLVGTTDALLSREPIETAGFVPTDTAKRILWTDDYSSIFALLK